MAEEKLQMNASAGSRKARSVLRSSSRLMKNNLYLGKVSG